MATTLNSANFNVTFGGNISGAVGVGGSPIFAPTLTVAALAFANGVAAINKANQLYTVQTTVANASHNDLNIYTMGGVNDAVGNAFTMGVLKLLILLNLTSTPPPAAPTESDVITLGGTTTTAALTSLFGTNADTYAVKGGGGLVLWDAGAAGYTVGSSATNNTIRIGNAGATTITYQLIIVGSVT